jgi:dipeptidyl aminopeptidase/acylaminoacyl peptidase
MKTDDFFRLRFLSDLEAYRDNVYFVVTRAIKEKNEYESKIWSLGDMREFTSGPRDLMPKVSPDGKFLAFLRKSEKKVSLMIMPMDGGEAKVLIERKEISMLKWSKNGNIIYFVSNIEEKSKDDVKIIRRYPFYFNGKGFIYDKRPALFSVNLNGKSRIITNAPYNVQDYDVSRDGKIALIMSIDDQKIYWNNIYIKNGKKFDKLPFDGSFSDLEFSPDGKYLAFSYSDNSRSIFQHRHLYLYNIDNGSFECINCGMDRSIGNSLNSDSRMGMGKSLKWWGDSLYFLINDSGESVIYLYKLKDRKIIRHFSNNMGIDFFILSDSGIYSISQKINEPQEIYLNKKKITNFNSSFNNLPKPNKFHFNSSDGEKVQGWILLNPRNGSPTILEIHGGPKTLYGESFMFEFFLLYYSGFNVIFMNPRGSDGYSEKFALDIRGKYGERDYMDIMEGLEYCINEFNLDKEKLGITGGSYGGFMTNWIIGHSKIFKAAVTQRSISNQISFFGTSDIGPEFNGDQIGGTPFENIYHYWEKSPLKYVKNVETPLLIIHSDEDYRCPIEQAYQLFTSLKFFGKNVEMAIFPGENHDLSRSGRPNHRTRRLELIEGWFKKYLQGKI